MTWLEEKKNDLRKNLMTEMTSLKEKPMHQIIGNLREKYTLSVPEVSEILRESGYEVEDIEEVRAKIAQLARQLPRAGYIDKDGATVLPASWREED